jgi:hypothetical protein
MAIATIITRGFGNGTFSGSIGLVVVRGYLAAEETPATSIGCVHISNTARYTAKATDTDRYIVQLSKSDRYAVTISDEGC